MGVSFDLRLYASRIRYQGQFMGCSRSPYTIGALKLLGLKWVEHVIRIGEETTPIRILTEQSFGRRTIDMGDG